MNEPLVLTESEENWVDQEIARHENQQRESARLELEAKRRQEAFQARQYQQWEDWVMHHELHSPVRRQRPRLLLRLQATCEGHERTADVLLPMPEVREELRLDMRMTIGTVVESVAETVADEDVTNLMQTNNPTLTMPRARPEDIIESLQPHHRQRVVHKLLRMLRLRLPADLRRAMLIVDFLKILQTMAVSMEGMLCPPHVEMSDAAVEDVALLVLECLDREHCARCPDDRQVEEDAGHLVSILQNAVFDVEDCGPRQRRTAASSLGSTQVAHSRGVLQQAEMLKEHIYRAANACETGRNDTLREITVVLTEALQQLAVQMHIHVLLLADLTPQPYAETGPASASRRFGRMFARDLLTDLRNSLRCNAEDVLEGSCFGVQELIPIIEGINPAIMEAMALLEEAELPDHTSEHSDEFPDSFTPAQLATHFGGAGPPQYVLDALRAGRFTMVQILAMDPKKFLTTRSSQDECGVGSMDLWEDVGLEHTDDGLARPHLPQAVADLHQDSMETTGAVPNESHVDDDDSVVIQRVMLADASSSCATSLPSVHTEVHHGTFYGRQNMISPTSTHGHAAPALPGAGPVPLRDEQHRRERGSPPGAEGTPAALCDPGLTSTAEAPASEGRRDCVSMCEPQGDLTEGEGAEFAGVATASGSAASRAPADEGPGSTGHQIKQSSPKKRSGSKKAKPTPPEGLLTHYLKDK